MRVCAGSGVSVLPRGVCAGECVSGLYVPAPQKNPCFLAFTPSVKPVPGERLW